MSELWIERWQEGRIGWHEQGGNASLRRYWEATGRRVLVPLCGKSLDLLWLARQDNEVVGVELSDLAARAFFEENELDYDVDRNEGLKYRARDVAITIVCGDYYEFAETGFDAHYDRGALVAVPADERPAYAAHTNALLTPAARQLVITLEYDQDRVDGPPWSIAAEELLGYWPRLVKTDAYDDLANAPPKFRDAGLGTFTEVVWRSP